MTGPAGDSECCVLSTSLSPSALTWRTFKVSGKQNSLFPLAPVVVCGRTKRVNWVYFLETWLKILNNLTRLKVGYNKITGLYFMSDHAKWVMKWVKSIDVMR